ncbi:hypothetical protein SRABI128_01682 [Microbacterium sp. Bi128]|nr:hypothetical protein SRABI128_01682 [Microbacterium sp. Bi128]
MLADAERLVLQHAVAVEQDHGAVAPARERLGPARGDHQGRGGIHLGHGVGAVGDDDARVRERPAQLIGGSLAARRRHAQLHRATVTARPGVGAAPTPRAHGHRARTRRPEGARTVSTPCRTTAVRAHERWGVPRAGDLHEHRTLGQRFSCRGERRRRHAGRALLPLARRTEHHARTDPPLQRRLAHVPDLDQTLHVGRAGVPGEDERGSLQLLPHERGIPCMHSGGQGLRQQRIAVVPQRHQAGLVGRGVHRRPPSHDDHGYGRQGAQELGVPRRARLVRVVAHDRLGRHQIGQRRHELRLVAVVGHDEHRAPPPRERAHRRSREQIGPGPPGQIARGMRRSVDGDALAAVEGVDQTRVGRQQRLGARERRGRHDGNRGCGRGQPRLLGAHHPLGHGQAQDVAHRPRGAIRDPAGERVQPLRQHRHRRDDRLHRRQRALTAVVGDDLDHEGIHHPTRRAQRDLDAHARGHFAHERVRNGVVEQPIQLRHRRIQLHPRHAPGAHVRRRGTASPPR